MRMRMRMRLCVRVNEVQYSISVFTRGAEVIVKMCLCLFVWVGGCLFVCLFVCLCVGVSVFGCVGVYLILSYVGSSYITRYNFLADN